MKPVLYIALLVLAVHTAAAREGSDSLLVVRAVAIEGNLTTKDHVILREMKLKPGEFITRESLEHDEKRIYSLGLFNTVELEVKPEGREAVVVVQVDERWYLFPFPVFGFRYRDFDKVFYGAGVVHQNFRGRNEKLFFNFALGFDRWVKLSYYNPRLTEDDLALGIEAKYSEIQSLEVETDMYDQTNIKLGLSVGKRFGLYTLLQGLVNYDVWKISEPGLGRTVSSGGRDAFVSIGGSLTLDQRDIREYPTDGHLLIFSAVKYGFGESPVDFFRYGFDARLYQPALEEVSLAGRMFANFAGGGEVPKYQRVYFGFLERLRGYFFEGLEGEHIAGGNAEVRVQLLSPRTYVLPEEVPQQFRTLRYGLYLGIFADAGTVWFRGQDLFKKRWYSGYGAGFHVLLPYSLVMRTEYAWNMEGRGEFVFDLGASF